MKRGVIVTLFKGGNRRNNVVIGSTQIASLRENFINTH